MKRREAREILFCLIFEASFDYASDGDASDNRRTLEKIYEYGKECREFDDDPYICDIFFNIWDSIPKIDELIATNSVGWKHDRLSRVSQAIMRLCVYEMLFRDDIPYSISINEAIELAKKYDHDNSPKFINGVVNAIAEKENLKK